jgi:hypothetical protein
MKILPFNLCFILCLGLFPPCTPTYGDDFDHKIRVLTEKIKSEQDAFPQGSYEDRGFVEKSIELMYQTDQEVRRALLKEERTSQVHALLHRMDHFHTEQLKEILKIHGWLTVSQFGEEMDRKAWLLVQHGDHDLFFQAACVFILGCLRHQKETDGKNYAYLYDRVALKLPHLGLKQRYGTQVSITSKGVELSPHEGTLEEVEERRKEIGLEPLHSYLKTIKEMY